MLIFITVFVLLTILHPIGDFMVAKRRFRGEFWIVLNPLHWLWDSSRFRKHGKHIAHFRIEDEEYYALYKNKCVDRFNPPTGKEQREQEKRIGVGNWTHGNNYYVVEQTFWFWLGLDQLAHVLLNIVTALFVDYVINLF